MKLVTALTVGMLCLVGSATVSAQAQRQPSSPATAIAVVHGTVVSVDADYMTFSIGVPEAPTQVALSGSAVGQALSGTAVASPTPLSPPPVRVVVVSWTPTTVLSNVPVRPVGEPLHPKVGEWARVAAQPAADGKLTAVEVIATAP